MHYRTEPGQGRGRHALSKPVPPLVSVRLRLACSRTLNNRGGTRTTTTYHGANQIVYSRAAAGRTTYTFDANGNQQVVRNPDNTRTTTTWDYENQPTLYKLSTGARVTMAYNADNQRTRKDS